MARVKKHKCREEAASQIPDKATSTIWGNPTVKCADGNTHVVSPRNNVGKSKNPTQINCQDKNAMKENLHVPF
nr:hypothetical protein BSM_18820 [uncultured archaeon]